LTISTNNIQQAKSIVLINNFPTDTSDLAGDIKPEKESPDKFVLFWL
jgi:hypothetical protein